MINKILKAASVKVSTIAPLEVGILTHPEPFQAGTSSDETEMIIAETKLITYQLLNDAKLQAETIIGEAEAQAAQMLEKTKVDARAIEDQAKQAGYRAGRRTGLSELEQARKDAEDERISQQQSLEQARLDMIRELEPSLIQMAMQIAKKIIHAELRLFPEQAAKIAEAVLAQVKDPGQIVLKTSSVDQKLVAPLAGKNGARIEMRVDDALKSGDFVAQTSLGLVDGTIEGQLGVIGHQLMEAAGND